MTFHEYIKHLFAKTPLHLQCIGIGMVVGYLVAAEHGAAFLSAIYIGCQAVEFVLRYTLHRLKPGVRV